MTETGSVRRWVSDEGWGVLDSPATPGGCWAHFSAVAVPGYRELQDGESVDFEYERVGQDGFDFRATRVWPSGSEPFDMEPEAPGPGLFSTLTIAFDHKDTSPADDDLQDRHVYLLDEDRELLGVYRASWYELVCLARGDEGFELNRRSMDTERGNRPPRVVHPLAVSVPVEISLDPMGPLVCTVDDRRVSEKRSRGGAVITYRHIDDRTICAHPLRVLPNTALLDFLVAQL